MSGPPNNIDVDVLHDLLNCIVDCDATLLSPFALIEMMGREVLKNLRLRISAIVGNELRSANEQQALGIAVLVLGNAGRSGD